MYPDGLFLLRQIMVLYRLTRNTANYYGRIISWKNVNVVAAPHLVNVNAAAPKIPSAILLAS